MRFLERKKVSTIKDICLNAVVLIVIGQSAMAQQAPELQTTTVRLGHLWLGMPANGSSMTFDPTNGFFPNDYGIMSDRAQAGAAFTGAGITMGTVRWPNPNRPDENGVDTVENPAVYGFTNTYMQTRRVTVPLTNYLRYQYVSETINGSPTGLKLFGTYKQSLQDFQNHTYDEVAEVTDSTVFGITVDRKVLAWSQNFNDDYVIADLVFTNITSDTLDSLYINMQESGGNSFFSQGNNPAASFDPTMTWQHYYGGRQGDSMRVFYEYSADNPRLSGDNMGAPVISQKGRLLAPNMSYYAILHASSPFDSTNVAGDVDDPFQPRVTYIGVTTHIPYNSSDDIYGNKNFSAMRGAYSNSYPMTGQTLPGTYHGLNSDELGAADYTGYIAGAFQSISYKSCSFGPYTFMPGQKIHIVLASGFTGIGYQKGQEIGQEWLNGTLQDPPNMPDPNTGWLPSNFQFPANATEIDKRKDRWISMGIDSVMLSAWRAKWNFDHNYNIPQAPPPPATVNIVGTSHAVEIDWTDPQAETMSNFAGYRIMRRVSARDSVSYQAIYDSDSTDISASHTFVDSTAIYLSQAYYYVQSKARIGYNDPNADPTTRGDIMYSGRNLYPNIYPINRPGPSQDDLSKIRVVPNPYNIKDPMLVVFGYTDQRGISFVNLPPVCTIKIFTENGDLVQTIVHNEPITLSGSVTWNMLTSSQQVIYGGVYIAVFQTPDGRISYQKFVVVR